MTFFFEFSLGPFEVVEAEGGRLVKEADFEAEKFFLLKQKIQLSNFAFHVMVFLVSMGKTGLSHDIFFEFSVGPFEVVEVE